MEDSVSAEMPRYRCHKEVHALKITGMETTPGTGGATLASEHPYGPIYVSAEWLAKHPAEVGGYYVVYEDGYSSFSPARAFEGGYTRI
jgi:hypothetical protein